ncbi:MAG: CBS domain-containing protein [Candidatus Aenigmarchaeota archaeon]|nr:CBS domain-containing protein [Candidatus Aenigmarchaeota archaeon]MDW8149543.1 CBS domain-containing protein [Candidatus Aenigmarchaeota archaeon]
MPLKLPVKKVMRKKVVTAKTDESAMHVAIKMAEKRVGSVIIEENGNPVGIITERDLTKKIVASGKNPKEIKAKEIMSSPLVFVAPNDDSSIAVEKMKKHKIKRLPVIENGKVVGIVTTTDLAITIPEYVEILKERMAMKASKPLIQNAITSGICEVCGNYSDSLMFEDDQWMCEDCREE